MTETSAAIPDDIIEAAARAMDDDYDRLPDQPCVEIENDEFVGRLGKDDYRQLARSALTAAAPMIAEMCANAAEDAWNGRSNTKSTIQGVVYYIRALFPPPDTSP